MSARSPGRGSKWDSLDRAIVGCARCPRLRAYCRQVAQARRAAFSQWDYWGKPVPNFGDSQARLLVVGLAPAAHGGNRTGRVFTGDRSGQWLFRALYRAGFANQPTSTARDDGLTLKDCAVTAVLHCAPPANKPRPDEVAHCHEWFARTIDLLDPQVYLALGQIAWRAVAGEARTRGWHQGPLPRFGHGATVELAGSRWLVGSYHPSQQNTFTGRLTETMFDNVFELSKRLLARR